MVANVPYDNLFHLFIELTLTNGQKWVLEKIERINLVREDRSKKAGAEFTSSFPVGKTVNELFQNTRNKMGDRFLPYQSASNNCQVFIMGVLDGNGLNNSDLTSFVKQDTKSIFKDNPVLRKFANTLTDTQKVIAEFWAGGPFTVAPPGMFVWFWKEYMLSTNTTINHDYTSFFYSAFELGIQLFEISRLVWGLKKDNMQARPIQDIRRLYASVPADGTIKKYDGTNIAGNVWVPYQASNFVTPPFADFPSGHSGFSQCFANVMTKWFGSSIPSTTPRTVSDMNLLSKIFTGVNQTTSFGSYTIPAGVSEIQSGIVPASPITLTWSTWQDMATSAGVSRQYGGIHCVSANTGSQVVANNLLGYVNTNWGITV
jgi:hypothetical protein